MHHRGRNRSSALPPAPGWARSVSAFVSHTRRGQSWAFSHTHFLQATGRWVILPSLLAESVLTSDWNAGSTSVYSTDATPSGPRR